MIVILTTFLFMKWSTSSCHNHYYLFFRGWNGWCIRFVSCLEEDQSSLVCPWSIRSHLFRGCCFDFNHFHYQLYILYYWNHYSLSFRQDILYLYSCSRIVHLYLAHYFLWRMHGLVWSGREEEPPWPHLCSCHAKVQGNSREKVMVV